LCCFFCFASIASTLTVSLEPANAQIAPGNKVKVNIFAKSAEYLISMGVKVSFDPAFLSVASASKYEDVANGWLLDGAGDPATTDDQFNLPLIETTSDSVTMIGAHGPGVPGLDGKVLLGWIVFTAQSATGFTDIGVTRARFHPSHPSRTFDNFVSFDGSTTSVVEPTNLPDNPGADPAVFATIYVGSDACEGDINHDGEVNVFDLVLLKLNFYTHCNNLVPGELCVGDLNGDDEVNVFDLVLLKLDFYRSSESNPCPVFP
jgi:hypothetical protein